MAITFQHKIILRPGSVFCFGTISSVADEEGTLHHIADPPERKPSSTISGKAGAKQEKAQPPALRAKTTSCKPGAEDPSTRRTPLSTSSTEKWTRITRKKETNEVKARQAALLVPQPSKENRKKLVAMAGPFYPDVLFIGGEWNHPPSPTMNQPRRGRNLFSRNLADEGTDAEISGDIMKPESGTRCNLCHEMRSRGGRSSRRTGLRGKKEFSTMLLGRRRRRHPSLEASAVLAAPTVTRQRTDLPFVSYVAGRRPVTRSAHLATSSRLEARLRFGPLWQALRGRCALRA
jgi:hypothetical protein